MSISAIGNTPAPSAATSTEPSSLSASDNAAGQGAGTTAASASYYTSPILTTDSVTGALILEYRDTKSGDELYQQPSRVAQEYRAAQQLAAKK